MSALLALIFDAPIVYFRIFQINILDRSLVRARQISFDDQFTPERSGHIFVSLSAIFYF